MARRVAPGQDFEFLALAGGEPVETRVEALEPASRVDAREATRGLWRRCGYAASFTAGGGLVCAAGPAGRGGGAGGPARQGWANGGRAGGTGGSVDGQVVIAEGIVVDDHRQTAGRGGVLIGQPSGAVNPATRVGRRRTAR